MMEEFFRAFEALPDLTRVEAPDGHVVLGKGDEVQLYVFGDADEVEAHQWIHFDAVDESVHGLLLFDSFINLFYGKEVADLLFRGVAAPEDGFHGDGLTGWKTPESLEERYGQDGRPSLFWKLLGCILLLSTTVSQMIPSPLPLPHDPLPPWKRRSPKRKTKH